MQITSEKPTRGRPTKLTPEVEATILEAIGKGASRVAAAAIAQVSEHSLKDWLSRGEGHDPDRPAVEPYIAFATKLRRQEAALQRDLVQRLVDAANGGSLDAAKWVLERRFPHDFGNRVKTENFTEISGPGATGVLVLPPLRDPMDDMPRPTAPGGQ